MRLIKIKLAGFKSFVDPTTFHLPSNLIGIVGPNGCGKSNVIDAVRWVMGESSARYLRGESMDDVIFNGSSARKPVGQASTELVFDNSQGRLSGPFAQYTEISIKRLLNRSGESGYFLNGTRCRRRDITDIFLGTGLGARSYAIIEQGMISRLVEARPEELRVFLEEAAGISKYKERRRETELRIRHTRENLDRLGDVRDELGKQHERLQRQARVAERYRHYRRSERRLKAELLALRWRGLEADAVAREQILDEQKTALEAVLAQQRSLEARLERSRMEQTGLTANCAQAQQRYYELNVEISRLEQIVEHRRQLRERQGQELRQSEHACHKLVQQLQTEAVELQRLEQALQHAEPVLQALIAEEADAETRIAGLEAEMGQWQEKWEEFNHRASEPQRAAEVERTRAEQLEQQLAEHSRRLQKLSLEHADLNASDLSQDYQTLEAAQRNAVTALHQAETELTRLDAKLTALKQTQTSASATLHDLEAALQANHGRLAALQAAQETALGAHGAAVDAWLQDRELAQAPRLAQCLEVEAGWEQAAETVLGPYLGAVCVTDLPALVPALAEMRHGNLTLVDTAAEDVSDRAADSLASKVQAPWPLDGLLSRARLARDLHEAVARRAELNPSDTWITPDDDWLGSNWLRIVRGDDDGRLRRAREIQALQTAQASANEQRDQQLALVAQIDADLQGLETARKGLQATVARCQQQQTQAQGRMAVLQGQQAQMQRRAQQIAAEQSELTEHQQHQQALLQRARLAMERAILAIGQLSEERQALVSQRDVLGNALQSVRAKVGRQRQQARQQGLEVESLRAKLGSLRQSQARLQTQQTEVEARRVALAQDLSRDDEPLAAAQQRLQTLLHDRVAAQAALSDAQGALAAQEAALNKDEQARLGFERQVQGLRQALEGHRIVKGEINARQQALEEQLHELDMALPTLLAEISATATEAACQQALTQLGQRIQRLGAVNLAAIDECAEVSERKGYLDAQRDDLVAALTTLEEAMGKIDRETRTRFKDTFARVNTSLQALFPRLFGGGEAYLQLTGEDMLEAGVTVMARPPGKRIGTIHLLSGGEKALTAVALVFAIFQLNPAPFCMLDEVDAPLDEANIERFGDLVRDIAKQVQVILITHNKTTMGIAHHLAGVTMHEPGVSRLVAVDVDEALRLAIN